MRLPPSRPVIGLLAVLLLSGCSLSALEENPLLGGELTVQRETEMAAEVHRKIRSQARFVNDPVVLAYLNDLGQRIVHVTEPQPFLFRFNLLESDELNAFTVGGGYVYVSSGVLEQAGDVSELAGVLAHEIAHVRKRHIAKASQNQGLTTLTTLAAIAVILAGGEPVLMTAAQGINVALQLKNSREQEAEADREAIDYLVRAGYDPSGMVRFFQRILASFPRGGGKIPPYLYSHPALEERIASAEVAIEHTALPPDLAREDPRLDEIQARLSLVLKPAAGGSGLLARPSFDRAVSDPYLEKARVQLEQAFRIDPTVPLVQYRLGRIHKRLGNRCSAVFYLEQAANNFKPGSAGRSRAELELEQLVFQVFDASGLGTRSEEENRDLFVRGEQLLWWGRINPHIQTYNPKVRVRWTDPSGKIALDDSMLMSLRGRVSSTLDTTGLPLGAWNVEVTMEGSAVERHEFRLVDERPGGRGGE